MADNTTYTLPEVISAMAKCRSVYFIGIGGSSMSALASMTLKQGYYVGGSDNNVFSIGVKQLIRDGIRVVSGHDTDIVLQYDAVVYTLAVTEDNHELQSARQKGLFCISRANYMAWLLRDYTEQIAVCGTHGKSTGTLMTDAVWETAGMSPATLVGALSSQLDEKAFKLGAGRTAVYEACEYRNSFLSFSPTDIILLNAEWDHTDFFISYDMMLESYRSFVGKAEEKQGIVVYNKDDLGAEQIMRTYQGKKISCGMTEDADYCAKDILATRERTAFSVYRQGRYLCRTALAVPGKHNVMTALCVLAMACEKGIPIKTVQEGLESFAGAHRRLEKHGQWHGQDLYEDYAHHPTEIRAVLQTMRDMGYSHVTCVFQPHTFSRTYALFDGFVSALKQMDRVFLCDIFPAREENKWGVTSSRLAQAVGPAAEYCRTIAEITERLQNEPVQGGVILVMGAGDIGNMISEMKKCEIKEIKQGEKE